MCNTPSASQVRTPIWLTAGLTRLPSVVVTMSIHKLSAGSGYDYLTRQVAALDATEKGHVGLASYYTERGETPGAWIGFGMTGIDGLDAGDAVTAEQMRALFGAGMHPLAAQLGDAVVCAARSDCLRGRGYLRLHWFHLLLMLARQVLGAVHNDQEDRQQTPQH